MATAQIQATLQYELRALADYEATFSELLEHLEERNAALGRNAFSADQEEDLQLYCWTLHHCKSRGMPFGGSRVPEAPDDIGA